MPDFLPLDDESLLSAYLDGELDASRRLKVESALLAQPRLAERLQELAAIRSLVDGLSRPTVEYDLSPAVLHEIRTDPILRFQAAARALRARPGRLALASCGTIAAGLLVAFALRGSTRPPVARPRAPRANFGPVVTIMPAPRVTAPAAIPLTPVRPPVEVVTRPPTVPATALGEADRLAAAEHERLLRLLDRPGVRRWTLPVDRLSTDELVKVEGAIDRTRRHDPVRVKIRIGQDLVIDPGRPNEAVVYLVVLNDTESDRLRENLLAAFPERERVESQDIPSPTVLTQMAEVRELQFGRSGPDAPILAQPPAELDAPIARREDPRPPLTPVSPGPPRAATEVVASRNDAGSRPRPRDAVFLLWVTTVDTM
jgi:anti-sigma factor RsiW